MAYLVQLQGHFLWEHIVQSCERNNVSHKNDRIRALLLTWQRKELGGKHARNDLQIPEHCCNWKFFCLLNTLWNFLPQGLDYILFFFLTQHLGRKLCYRQDILGEKLLLSVGKASNILCYKETSVAIHLLWCKLFGTKSLTSFNM